MIRYMCEGFWQYSIQKMFWSMHVLEYASKESRPSTNSNESYDGYGYVMSDYSGTSYGAQDDKKRLWTY